MKTQKVKRFTRQPKYSTRTSLLIERLNGGVPGDIATDAELSEIAGTNVREGMGMSALRSAMRFCLLHGVVWQRVRGEGLIECLDADGKIAYSDGQFRGICRKAGVATQVLGSINRDELTESRRREFDARFVQAGTLFLFANGNTTRSLADRSVSKPVDQAAVLRLFGANGKK